MGGVDLRLWLDWVDRKPFKFLGVDAVEALVNERDNALACWVARADGYVGSVNAEAPVDTVLVNDVAPVLVAPTLDVLQLGLFHYHQLV